MVKTTLIKILNGLLQPTSGLVTINGFQPSPITKAQVAYLPDTTYLDESKTIQYYLDFFQDFYADFRYPLALQLLQDLKLQPDLRLKDLSKGNKEKSSVDFGYESLKLNSISLMNLSVGSILRHVTTFLKPSSTNTLKMLL